MDYIAFGVAVGVGLLGYIRLRDLRAKDEEIKEVKRERVKLSSFPSLKNDLLLRAAKRQKTERVPVWMMRQAGRYLPEYRGLRNDFTLFFEICRSPELAKTASLQPLERFSSLDADILVVPQAMGMEVKMEKGRGPVFPAPLESPADIDLLVMNPNIEETLGYVFDGINLTRECIAGRVPLIGFSGGPWTLMAYMVEGHGTKTWEKCKTWLYNHPKDSHRLLAAITDILIAYLVGQVKAGAQLLQVFESWGGELPPHLFMEFSLPYLKKIATEVKASLPVDLKGSIPMTVFGRGLHFAVEALSNSDYDVVGLDWTQSPVEARKIVDGRVSLQGNLDPCALYGSEAVIKKEVRRMLTEFGTQNYIANLGHGMHPSHSPEHAGFFIKAVQDISSEMNAK